MTYDYHSYETAATLLSNSSYPAISISYPAISVSYPAVKKQRPSCTLWIQLTCPWMRTSEPGLTGAASQLSSANSGFSPTNSNSLNYIFFTITFFLLSQIHFSDWLEGRKYCITIFFE